MNLAEKILCHQSTSLTTPIVRPGEVIVVKVARTIASELTLVGIETCLKAIGDPELWRHDRFFLGCDHSVDPQNYHEEIIKKRIQMCSDFSGKHKLMDYFGPNESIIHTEFYRQRASPGTVIIGADSHSCSHGCVGAYAMGMGASDVTMPLVTGTSWLRVPETVLITFVGTLKPGLVGKDVMLWILKTFGRNTVALDRCIEFGGNIGELDIDSRFAISNMVTEFGALAGIFPADEITQGFLEKRWESYPSNRPRESECGAVNGSAESNADEQEDCLFFSADPDASYYQKLTLDLSEVQPAVARWPSPDHVYLLNDKALDEPLYDGTTKVCDSVRQLDGCFIGACTTAENEIILAGLLLEVMLDQSHLTPKERPATPYQRRVTPGSRVMTERLESLGILSIYRRAGFIVGAAGCSYCLGVAHDKAKAGEVWLSSQNRNFKHRMGRGAIGSVSSACVVAASSFSMSITDPSAYLAKVDMTRYRVLADVRKSPFVISEPKPSVVRPSGPADGGQAIHAGGSEEQPIEIPIVGRAQVFGDSVDTDAIIPAQFIPLRGKEQGEKSFCIQKPEFVKLVKENHTIVVGGTGFGCGSSREEAVSCLRFCGVKAVIAKSFSFIFGRNLLTVNLLGITLQDERFFEAVKDGTEIEVNILKRTVRLPEALPTVEFHFDFSPIQETIMRNGGIIQMYCKMGKQLYKHLAEANTKDKKQGRETQSLKECATCASEPAPEPVAAVAW